MTSKETKDERDWKITLANLLRGVGVILVLTSIYSIYIMFFLRILESDLVSTLRQGLKARITVFYEIMASIPTIIPLTLMIAYVIAVSITTLVIITRNVVGEGQCL